MAEAGRVGIDSMLALFPSEDVYTPMVTCAPGVTLVAIRSPFSTGPPLFFPG